MFASAAATLIHFSNELPIRPGVQLREWWIALAFLGYQAALAFALLRFKSRALFYVALPMAVAKFLPTFSPDNAFGFLGISYVSFRAIDVIFSIHDGVIKSLSPIQYAAYLFFFPTISEGPIDRYRRFSQDWNRQRTRHEFLIDLDEAVQRIFRGFLYKFILAALIKTHWVDRMIFGSSPLHSFGYMYSYSLYLFFDFAGYSAFAIGTSYLFGVRTPENFQLPFLAPNIRDFWNRWHITLSYWLRDHVYMRFLLTAAKGKWFKGKYTASYIGLFLTFGLMGLWHGSQLQYLIYGLYHATLPSGYDWFARWNKQHKLWGSGPALRALNIVLTVHAVCFGFLIFSGHLK